LAGGSFISGVLVVVLLNERSNKRACAKASGKSTVTTAIAPMFGEHAAEVIIHITLSLLPILARNSALFSDKAHKFGTETPFRAKFDWKTQLSLTFIRTHSCKLDI